jgi:hypothetical protein
MMCNIQQELSQDKVRWEAPGSHILPPAPVSFASLRRVRRPSGAGHHSQPSPFRDNLDASSYRRHGLTPKDLVQMSLFLLDDAI